MYDFSSLRQEVGALWTGPANTTALAVATNKDVNVLKARRGIVVHFRGKFLGRAIVAFQEHLKEKQE